MRKVVVFGSSGCVPGSMEYERAENLGSGLARAGYSVVSGGYSGTMEGLSKGASKHEGIEVRQT